MLRSLWLALVLTSVFIVVGNAQTQNESISILFIDNSGSLRQVLPFEVELATEVAWKATRNGELSICYFGRTSKSQKDTVNLVTGLDWSSDRKTLVSHLDSVFTIPGLTTLRDSIWDAVEKIVARSKANETKQFERVLILISDGEDRASKTKNDDLIKFLKESNVKILVIGLLDDLSEEGGFSGPSPKETARNFLEKIVKATKGKLVVRKKKQTASEIVEELFRMEKKEVK